MDTYNVKKNANDLYIAKRLIEELSQSSSYVRLSHGEYDSLYVSAGSTLGKAIKKALVAYGVEMKESLVKDILEDWVPQERKG